jgi:hypothetical protein
MDVAGSQDGGDQVFGLTVEGQQREVHVLPVVAVVLDPFLLPEGRVVRLVQVQHHPRRRPGPAALTGVQVG